MTHRAPQPSQPTGIHDGMANRDDDDPPPPVWRNFIEATVLTSDQVKAIVESQKRNHAEMLAEFSRVHRRIDVVEAGVLELVVENRARKNEVDRVRIESAKGREEIRAELAKAARTSAVDEEERAVIVDLAKTGVQAARAHIGQQTDASADALAARQARRALLVAGAKRAAVIVVPILSAAAGVLATLIAKGC